MLKIYNTDIETNKIEESVLNAKKSGVMHDRSFSVYSF